MANAKIYIDAFLVNAPKGWECPRCHKIYSPYVDECNCIGAGNKTHKSDIPSCWPRYEFISRTDKKTDGSNA